MLRKMQICASSDSANIYMEQVNLAIVLILLIMLRLCYANVVSVSILTRYTN